MKSKLLDIKLSPFELYTLVNREYRESFLLESSKGKERLARYSFIGFDPSKHLKANGKIVQIEYEEREFEQPIDAIKEQLPRERIERKGFIGGAVGYFSYDYARNLEQIPDNSKNDLKFPDFEFGIFDDAIVYDHIGKKVEYIYKKEDRSDQIMKLAKEEMFLGPFEAGSAKSNMGENEFCDAVEVAKESIKTGDIFQAVLSRRYEIPYEGNLLKFYSYLKRTNPSPYMYFLSFQDRKIIGSSPENLVRVEGNRIDSYATLAGTRPRGRTMEEDARFETELMNDEKERAEHLMLVDLTRNDVGKVAKFGTVNVPELMEVHKFSHVQHLSSHISAELADGKDSYDSFNAIFPAGTLTGAPKVRAMEIIDKLERNRRGAYGGAVGYFSANGNCDFAIAIRTLVAQRQKCYVQAGAGIVYDSIPRKEFVETENKAKALIKALGVKTYASITDR
ncbi:MAG: anthranilate synthase component I family protein [Candidatus Micrarchaeota archaeon]